MRHGVVAVVYAGGRMLTIRRAPGTIAAGRWCFPGGGIEPGETQQEALIREFHEELGAAIEPLEPVWSYTVPHQLHLYWWRARLRTFEFRPNPAEVCEVRWRTYSDLCKEPELLDSNHAFLRFIGPRPWRAP